VEHNGFECPWKRWARDRRELSDWLAWITDQRRALEAGKEIRPPWVAWPDEDPCWIGWRQGNAEGWLKLIWLPFWSSLHDDQRHDYVERWNGPPEWQAYVSYESNGQERTEHELAAFALNKDAFRSPEHRR
jgi:hypothetical protein